MRTPRSKLNVVTLGILGASLGMSACGVAGDSGIDALGQSVIDPGTNSLTYERPITAENGWGPFELNRSNGESGPADGHVLTLNGKTYSHGFGVHALSRLSFKVDGKCKAFTSDIGVDDEMGSRGSVVFQVFADGAKLFDSGVMTGNSATRAVNVSIAGKNQLDLVVTNGGDNANYDHADWANPALLDCLSGSVTPPPDPTAAPAPPPAPVQVVYGAPITITRGGTYSGNWESLDARVPAVKIATAEPVIIEKSNLRGRGSLISASFTSANLTVRDTRGYGLNPNIAGWTPGRFLNAEAFNNIHVENCYLESTSGIYFRAFTGNAANGDTVKILRNEAKNIDGRQSDGNGGFSPSEKYLVQFVQFNDVKHVPNVEVAWNKVVNEAFKSAVEDNINIYVSSGTAESPFQIHDNYIEGGYAPDPVTQNYSGGGILLCDGGSATLADACGYIQAFGNTVINTTNYGIAISAGHDNAYYDNRVFSTGRLADGRPVKAQNVGMYVWNMHGDPSTTYFNNNGYNNVSSWQKVDVTSNSIIGYNNWWLPDCGSSGCGGNTGLNALVDQAKLDAELSAWASKASQSAGVIGPR